MNGLYVIEFLHTELNTWVLSLETLKNVREKNDFWRLFSVSFLYLVDIIKISYYYAVNFVVKC